jgi:hypothetical protein
MTTNLRILKPSRVRPNPGDVFVVGIGDDYLYGRVISTTAFAGWSMPGARLVYIFSTRTSTPTFPDRKVMRATHLLVAPMMTNNLPWSRGYFQTLGNSALEPGDVLPVHCFRASTGRYYDERANELSAVVEPCGDWGLHSLATIDDEISDALRIPRAPQG